MPYILQEMVSSWVDQMVRYCKLIPRLLPHQASYADVISGQPEIVDLVAKIGQVMDENHQACQDLQQDFLKYVKNKIYSIYLI